MKTAREEKKPATVGWSSRDVAGQGEHTELHSVTQFCIANERNASHAGKLAVIDALLYVAEHTPPGFRSLRRVEITPISTPWPEYIVNLAQFSGVDAVVANRGVFLIAERVTVCYKDELGRPASEVEPGWNRVKLCSIDGKVRHHDRDAPQLLISPDEQCFIWQPEGCLKKQRRVTFIELCELQGEMGARLARYEVAA